jgi:hypothetical protein
MTKTKDSSWDSEENEVKSNWIKFNLSEEQDKANCDKIKGTLVARRQVKSNIQGKENELVWVYDLLADEGQFHELDDKKKLIEEPIIINAGEVWSVGGKTGIDAQMRNIKLGQVIGFKFIDEKASKTKGFAPAKNIRVYAMKDSNGGPLLNQEWLDANRDPEAEFNAM